MTAFIAGLITGAIITFSGIFVMCAFMLGDRAERAIGTEPHAPSHEDQSDPEGAPEWLGADMGVFSHDPQLATDMERNHA